MSSIICHSSYDSVLYNVLTGITVYIYIYVGLLTINLFQFCHCVNLVFHLIDNDSYILLICQVPVDAMDMPQVATLEPIPANATGRILVLLGIRPVWEVFVPVVVCWLDKHQLDSSYSYTQVDSPSSFKGNNEALEEGQQWWSGLFVSCSENKVNSESYYLFYCCHLLFRSELILHRPSFDLFCKVLIRLLPQTLKCV